MVFIIIIGNIKIISKIIIILIRKIEAYRRNERDKCENDSLFFCFHLHIHILVF